MYFKKYLSNSLVLQQNSACIKDFHKLLKIRLTTQWHLMEGNNRESKPLIKERDVYRVLYSMHSSLEEVQDLVYSLKPTKITPIAKPDDVSIDEVFCNIKLSIIYDSLILFVI